MGWPTSKNQASSNCHLPTLKNFKSKIIQRSYAASEGRRKLATPVHVKFIVFLYTLRHCALLRLMSVEARAPLPGLEPGKARRESKRAPATI